MDKEILFFEEVRIPGQKKFGNILLPTIITQNPSTELELNRLTEAIKTQKNRFKELLEANGAVLLRGFSVRTAAEFNSVVDAFGYDEFAYVGGNAPRRHVAGRVFTANEAPSEQKIHFHHELAQTFVLNYIILMADEDPFIETKTDQNTKNGVVFPAIIAPNPLVSISFQRFVQSIKPHKTRFTDLLHKTGAILFRGFPVRAAADFDRVVDEFGFDELPYVGGAAPRSNVLGRVFTANESPPDQKIPFHHEMAQVPKFPSKLFFFCEEEPRSGGETPIVLSHHIYNIMKDKYPEFVAKLEQVGLIYVRILGEEDDPSSPIGRGWHSTFLTKDKSIAEERAAKLGMKLEWLKNGVKTIMGPIPAIKYDETRGRKIWFNSMVAAYTGWKDSRNDPRKAVTFGDGTPLPCEIIEDCLKVLDEVSVAIPWKQGDILLIDNLAVMHSRKSFEPPRRILASLCV